MAPFRITICGIEELAGHCETGVSHVLSILDPEWPVPEAFGQFGEHAKLARRFHDAIEEGVAGTTPPQPDHVARLLAFGRDPAAQALPGRGGPEIMEAILRIRPQAWPNLRIIELGDSMLGRGGDLVAAAHQVYRQQLAARRHSAEGMTAAGRGREVAVARTVAGAQ